MTADAAVGAGGPAGAIVQAGAAGGGDAEHAATKRLVNGRRRTDRCMGRAWHGAPQSGIGPNGPFGRATPPAEGQGPPPSPGSVGRLRDKRETLGRDSPHVRRPWHLATLLAAIGVLVILAAVIADRDFLHRRTTAPALPLRWVGPVPIATRGWPTVPLRSPRHDPFNVAWPDGNDAETPWVDITGVRYRFDDLRSWFVTLEESPPRGPELSRKGQVLTFGIVLDTTGDGLPDRLGALNNTAPDLEDFRVWVTNLATGETETRIGPPYGFPMEFRHPDEGSGGMFDARTVWMTFLGPEPDRGERHPGFYVFATLSEGGQVVAWDTAPNVGWAVVPAD